MSKSIHMYGNKFYILKFEDNIIKINGKNFMQFLLKISENETNKIKDIEMSTGVNNISATIQILSGYLVTLFLQGNPEGRQAG